MDVEVRYRLAGGCTVVDADVVACRMEMVIHLGAGCGQERHQVGPLCVGGLEERGDMPFRDDQSVAGRDWEAVTNGKRVLAVLDNAICG
jgi:hypothetical protein